VDTTNQTAATSASTESQLLTPAPASLSGILHSLSIVPVLAGGHTTA
jgi:hypothetical protein